MLTRDDVASEQIDLYLLDMESGEERRLTPEGEVARYGEVRAKGDAVYLVTDRTHDRGAVCRLDIRSGALAEIVNADDFTVGRRRLRRRGRTARRRAGRANRGRHPQRWRV